MYYTDPLLDSPPPTSQFRRPWSPDPDDPLPSTSTGRNNQMQNDYYHEPQQQFQFDYDEYPQYHQPNPRREASDVSVEALDLADYATNLRSNRANHYPLHYPQDMYPPSPPSLRPLAHPESLQVPSLVSRGPTLSSNTHSTPSRATSRRHYSLPPFPQHSNSSRTSHSSPQSHSNQSHRYPQIANLRSPHSVDQEIDISKFPSWSRDWYNNGTKRLTPASPPDIYTALPATRFDSAKRSPFDPSNINNHGYSSPSDLQPDLHPYAPSSSLGHDSARDLLPWSKQPLEYGPPIDAALKEERVRMLEREFGGRGNVKGDFLDEDGKPMIGTVDARGYLVTQSPKKRSAIRFAQVLLALAASIPSIYAALIIKSKGVPPPAGKPATFALYFLSVVTLMALLYLFLFRPCCTGKRKKPQEGNPLANGMMVLPIQGMPGGMNQGKGGNKGPKGRGSKGGGGIGDVQVNLIVDPHAFGDGQRGGEDSDGDGVDGDEWEGSVPGAYGASSASARRKRKRPRRSVFSGLAMEEEWKTARAWAKKIALFDAIGLVLWGATFVFILMGKKCPSGGYEGWCNAYNTSSAAACLLFIAFGVSTFFNVQDLHDSKTSPRTRA